MSNPAGDQQLRDLVRRVDQGDLAAAAQLQALAQRLGVRVAPGRGWWFDAEQQALEPVQIMWRSEAWWAGGHEYWTVDNERDGFRHTQPVRYLIPRPA